MRKLLTSLPLLICGITFSQMKVNHLELQKLKTQTQERYLNDLKVLKEKPGYTPEMIKSFAGFNGNIPIFNQITDSHQAIVTNTNWLYNEAIPGVNLSGLGMKVFIWDGGFINTTHQEFGGRAFNKETNQASNHATNVAGVIVASGLSTYSNGNNSKGMAYNATVYGYDFYGSNLSELALEAANPANSEYLVTNHSYGAISGWYWDAAEQMWYWYGNTDVSTTESVNFGQYGSGDSYLDELIYNSPQLIHVKSSGNDYGDGPTSAPAVHKAMNGSGNWVVYNNVFRPTDCGLTGYDCIPTGGVAKNIITVGAVESRNVPYSGPNSITIAGFSSVGPADDGRIKPDIVAVGTQVYTPTDGSNTAYTITQGTSFSAPQASGNILLLQELYKQKYDTYLRADMTKAVVIHTANELGEHPGPDYKFGWGLMDMKAAAELILGKDSYSLIDLNTLSNNATYSISVKAVSGQPLKVSISWLDPKGTFTTQHNDRTPKLVNDLDLRVSDGLLTYYPWKLDVNNPSAAATKGDNTLDNTEQVVIENPIPGHTYTITVSHKGNLVNNQQVFALVASGIEVGCKAPSSLNATEITSESAKLSWTSSSTNFDLEFIPVSSSPTGNPTHTNISNNFTVTDLSPGVTYKYYVRAYCEEDELSEWAGPYSFFATSTQVYDGIIGVSMLGPNIDINTESICPAEMTIEVPEGKKIHYAIVEYQISNLNGNLASDFKSLIYSPTLGIGESQFAQSNIYDINYTADYNRNLYFLEGATGTVKLNLRVFDTRYSYGLCYDAYAYVEPESWKVTPIYVDINHCIAPTGLSVSEINGETAKLSWISSNSSFDIELVESGLTPTGAPTFSNVSNNYTVSNLTLNQSYDYYVRSNCGSNHSTWVGPYTFVAKNEVVYNDSINVLWSGPNIDVNTANPCAGELTIHVPEGKKIAKVNVEYSINNINYNYASDYRSLIYSPTLNMGESSFASVNIDNINVTANYSRELPFLVNARGDVDLQLRVFDTRYSFGGCSDAYATVVAGSWKVESIFVDEDACLDPMSITSEANSTSSFTVNWQAYSNVDLLYGPTGFNLENGTLIQNISGSTYQVTNLDSNLAEYYLRSNCGDGNVSDWVGPFVVDFSYCTITSPNFNLENITNVSLANLNHSTSTHAGYNDFTHLVANVAQGETYPLNVSVKADSNNYIYAYIDWNQNLEFESNELIHIANDISSTGTYLTHITVPVDAILGNTRMRVVVSYGTEYFTACGNHSYGEIEDYTINVSGSEIIWTTEGAWSNVVGPNINTNAFIEGELILNNDLSAKDLTVREGGKIRVTSGNTLTLAGALVNDSTPDAVWIENDANLIQTTQAENSNPITVVRNSEEMVRLDYTMWSSPVAGQNVQGFSPETVANRIYTYEGAQSYQVVSNPESTNMMAAKGYLFRAPNNWWENGAPLPAQPFVGNFVGVPNNGQVSLAIHQNNYTSIGNPYPSNIDADAFLLKNPTVSTLYFWTNTNAATDGQYTHNNYSTYTLAGPSAASGGSQMLNGTIAVGQGFIVYSEGNHVQFDNSLRTDNPAVFMKNPEDQRNRFWIDLMSENTLGLNQILVGYFENATLGVDHQVDGKEFGNQGSAIYSIINDENYVIQGRPMPFDVNDVVPVGLRTVQAGNYILSLHQVEGIFAEDVQILIRDKKLDLVHNLSLSDYVFEANEGINNDRFEIIYQNDSQMGVNDSLAKNVSIYTQNDQIVVWSKSNAVQSVELFDLQGKNLHRKTAVNSNQYAIDAKIYKSQVLIVKVITTEGKVFTQKVIVK